MMAAYLDHLCYLVLFIGQLIFILTIIMPRETKVCHICCETINHRKYRTLTSETDCFLLEIGIPVAVSFGSKRLSCQFCFTKLNRLKKLTDDLAGFKFRIEEDRRKLVSQVMFSVNRTVLFCFFPLQFFFVKYSYHCHCQCQ